MKTDNQKTAPEIAIFTPTLEGGIGRSVTNLERGLREKGVSAEIWPAENGRVRSAFFPLVKKLRSRTPKALISASFHANCAAILAKVLSGKKFRLVIIEHTTLSKIFASMPTARRILFRALIRALYPLADGLAAVSAGAADDMARYSGVPRERISVIYNPVILPELFSKSKESVSHPFFEKGEPVILAAGALAPEKDFPILLKAFALANKEIAMRLIIIGEGEERKRLEEEADSLGISERVSLSGHKENPYPYFAHSDLFILSSAWEGLPTVLIEALALGKKVVSTDCKSGPREILKNGEYGPLVPVGDSQALAKAMTDSIRTTKKELPPEALRPYKIESVTDGYLKIALPSRN